MNTYTPPKNPRATSSLSPFRFDFSRILSGLPQETSNYTSMSVTPQSEQLIDCLTDTSTSTSSTPYNILSKNSEGQWEIVKSDDLDVQVFPFGHYHFVVMPNGEIRVQSSTPQRPISHSQLSNGTPVRSAGQLFFSKEGTQELEWWHNNSEEYPSKTVHENIGLPLEDFDQQVSDDEDTDNEELTQAFGSPSR